MITVLRIDNGLISNNQRCKDEPRFIYLKEQGEQVDFTTTNKKEALDISKLSEVMVHSKEWKQIIIK